MPRKPRKREYIPPEHEIVNRKERVRTEQRRPRNTQRSGRAGWEPPVPSWRRTFRRAPVYFVILLALQYFLIDAEAARELSTVDRLLVSAQLAGLVTIAFLPFLYWMERWSYRLQMRRIERDRRGSS